MRLYIDSSALMKLVTGEDESPDLISFLNGSNPWDAAVEMVSSYLARTEIIRASSRIGPEATLAAHRLSRTVTFLSVEAHTLDSAAIVPPATLRTLDALHVASASRGGLDIISYDHRLNAAAELSGLRVYSPGMMTSQ